jgi:hypothetical protein
MRDRAGEIYNGHTAIRFVEQVKKAGSRFIYWEFSCGHCGAAFVSSLANIRTRKSCGCVPPAIVSHALPPGISSMRQLRGTYLRGAKSRGLKFALSEEQFLTITSKPCYYCGSPPKRRHRANRKVNGSYSYNGIDRQDNNQGYMVDNCVACCKICNYAKRNLSWDEFKDWLNRLVAFRMGGSPVSGGGDVCRVKEAT